MKLVINGRFLGRRLTGVDRFALEVCRSIDKMLGEVSSSDISVKIITPENCTFHNEFKNIKIVKAGFFSGQFWEQFSLPLLLSKDEFLVSFCNTSPLFIRRQIVVVHDATPKAFPSTFSFLFRVWYSILIPLLGKRALSILTVSNFSMSEIIRRYGVDKHKISVVYESGEHIQSVFSDENVLNDFDLVKDKFVLVVSSHARHKNFEVVLKSSRLIKEKNIKIAVVGGSNSSVFSDSKIVVGDNVTWLGYVTDSQLKSLYENCLCFVFPSLYEGFGIPPLEAMACGAPVLAANTSSIPEVCGSAAIYFEPHNYTNLAKLINSIFLSVEDRRRLSKLGKNHASTYSWEKAAKLVFDECKRFNK